MGQWNLDIQRESRKNSNKRKITKNNRDKIEFLKKKELILSGLIRIGKMEEEQKKEMELIEIGISACYDDNFEDAIKRFSEAILINSDSSMAYHNRCVAKMELKDYEGALNDSNKAIELEPSHPLAYFIRGKAKMNLKDKSASGDFLKYSKLEESLLYDSIIRDNRVIMKPKEAVMLDYDPINDIDCYLESCAELFVESDGLLDDYENAEGIKEGQSITESQLTVDDLPF